MEQRIITFTADQQGLTKTGGVTQYASDTISYVKAIFTLGENWTGFDEVRAVFKTPYTCKPAVLDSLGECIVPWEVLMYKGIVRVNLVGSIYTEEEVVDRLTTHSVEALVVDEDVPVCGDASAPLTPSEYEQFVAKVATDANRAEAGATSAETSAGEAEASATASAQSATASANSASQAQTYAQNAQNYAVSAETAKDDAEEARDEILGMRATANTLAEGSDATASYSDGLLTLGIPRGNTGAKGDKGDTGATPNLSIGTVETLPPTGSSEVTIAGTAENPVLNFKLVKGDTGEVTMAQLAQLLPTDTASGEIASFPDGTDVFPAVSVLTTIEPIQSGSGTPSPTNIRPISGHTECVTSVSGKNLFDADNATIYNRTIYVGLAVWRALTDGSASIAFYCKPNTTYTVSYDNPNITLFRTALINTDPATVTATDYPITQCNGATTPQRVTTITTEADTVAILIQANRAVLTSGDARIQIELGSTATTYEPYNGNTYTTDLGRTVYGGTLDVVSGVLTVTDGYIASYNGETLPSTWISDRDVYASGTTPTTGAQVVYKLSTPTTYQLTPTEVQTLLGTNNLWTDCGSVNVTYKADTYLWVEKKLS